MSSAFFVVTDKCHLDCEFCFYKVGLNFDKQHRLSPSQLASRIPQLRKLGIQDIILTGGDPMLRKDLPEIVRLFSSAGFAVGILTAGDLLNRGKLVELRLAGLSLLCLPVDGPFSRPDLQRPGQQGLARLSEIAGLVGMQSSVSVVITTKNYKLVKEIYDDVKSIIKPNNIVFSPVSIGAEGWENQDLGLKCLSRADKVQLVGDLTIWAAEYNYQGYLDVIRASLLEEDVDYWPHCTMKKNLVFESNGDIYTCFSKKTPILGTLDDPNLSASVRAFRNEYRCTCSSDQCVTQFQKKDWVTN